MGEGSSSPRRHESPKPLNHREGSLGPDLRETGDHPALETPPEPPFEAGGQQAVEAKPDGALHAVMQAFKLGPGKRAAAGASHLLLNHLEGNAKLPALVDSGL